MTQDWDSWNARIPLTVLWIDACQVGEGVAPSVLQTAVSRHL